MNEAEFFKLLLDTSRNGGFPATNEYGGCQYLTEDGRKCAVGLVIPDGHPAQIEGCSARSLYERYPDLVERIPKGMNVADMTTLQGIHDYLSPASRWNHKRFAELICERMPERAGLIKQLEEQHTSGK